MRQNELRSFAQDRQRSVSQQVALVRRNLRPISASHLSFLNSLIEGSVSYVDQVNVLRTHLRNHANNIKAKVDRANAQIETLEESIKQSDLSFEALSRCAVDIATLDRELQTINASVSDFDNLYRHMLDWQRLIIEGSQLLNEIQQMGHLAVAYQDKFDELSRDIRGNISSKTNRLEALPSHSTYTPQLGSLIQEVRRIRRTAEDEFVTLQNGYYQQFTSNGLYTRERIGRPFEYNISNPEESYRLLHERVQKLASDLHLQIDKVVRERRHEILNVLNTPLFGELVEEDRRNIQEEGEGLIRLADDCIEQLAGVHRKIDDITVIRHFLPSEPGDFGLLISALLQAFSASRELSEGSKRLGQWLTDISLSTEEESLYSRLKSEDLDNATDIFEWAQNAKISSDDFWNLVRGLYEKHRIRVLVTRIRR